MNTINDIYQKIKKLYKDSVVEIDIEKFVNNRNYRLRFNCDKIIKKEKFKNISYNFNPNGNCYIDIFCTNKSQKNTQEEMDLYFVMNDKYMPNLIKKEWFSNLSDIT